MSKEDAQVGVCPVGDRCSPPWNLKVWIRLDSFASDRKMIPCPQFDYFLAVLVARETGFLYGVCGGAHGEWAQSFVEMIVRPGQRQGPDIRDPTALGLGLGR